MGAGSFGSAYFYLGATYHTITHNSDGTAKLYINGSISTTKLSTPYQGDHNYNTYGSGSRSSSLSIDLPTIPRHATLNSFNLSVLSMTTLKVDWSANSTIDRVEYTVYKNGAWSGWILAQTGDRTSGIFNIGDLNPGTQCTVIIRVKRKDSQLWTESSRIVQTTESEARFNSVPNNISIDDPFTITFNRNGATTVGIGIFSADGSKTFTGYKVVTGTSYEFSLTEEEKNNLFEDMSSTNKKNYRIYISTDSNAFNNYIERTLVVSNANPTFSNFEYIDENPITTDLTGNNQKIIKGYSDLRAIITTNNKMIANKGATAKEYQLVVGSKQTKKDYSNNENIGLPIKAIDNNVFTVYAIDSRGNSTQKQISPTIYFDYFKPVISELKVNRQNNISTLTNLSFSGTFSNVDFGAEENILIATYEYRNTQENDWIAGKTTLVLTINNNDFTFNGLVAGDLNAEGFNISDSFEIRIKIKDLLEEESRTEILVSSNPNFDLNKNGVGIMGQYNEEIGGLVQIGGDFLNYIIERGSNANGYYEKWNDGTLKQWGVKSSTEAQKTWVEITYPNQFYNTEIVFNANNQYVGGTTDSVLVSCVPDARNKDFAYVYLRLLTGNNPTFVVPVHWNATGKWK